MIIFDWLFHRRYQRHIQHEQALMDAYDRIVEANESACEICNKTAVYRCPKCSDEIETHSHENDYTCKTHGFVDPIREDGVRINGDGRAHAIKTEPSGHTMTSQKRAGK